MVLAALAVFRSIKTAKENLKYAIFEGDVWCFYEQTKSILPRLGIYDFGLPSKKMVEKCWWLSNYIFVDSLKLADF